MYCIYIYICIYIHVSKHILYYYINMAIIFFKAMKCNMNIYDKGN